MFILIVILSLLFFTVSFLGNGSVVISNPFVGFLFFQLHFFFHFLLFFLVACIGFVLFFITQHHRHTKQLSQRIVFSSIFQVVALLIISAFFACVGLFLVAILHANVTAFMLKNNPSFLGVTSDTKTVIQTLQKNALPPNILGSEPTSQKETLAVAEASVGTNNFYGSTILPSLPSFLILTVAHPSTALLTANTLILTTQNPSDLQKISPVLGFLLVHEYFPNRYIKSFPKVFVMNKTQFMKTQNITAKQKLTTVSQDITRIQDTISSLSAQIQNDKDTIATHDATTTLSMKQRDKEYNTCLSTGNYNKGQFVPTYTKTYCSRILDTWDTTLSKDDSDADRLQATLLKDQGTLKTYQYYDTFFKAQKSILVLSTSAIPDELGVFLPGNTIQIAIDSKNESSVITYLETLCHEYLHYASVVPGKRLDSSFFEEGLTEYFARKVIQDNLDITTNIAYPAQVLIIQAFSKRISEPDLADIYFTKDQAGLERKLSLAYGDNFYQNNFVSFESLQYTSDPSQITKLTNTLLKNLGEKPVSENEIFGE